MLWGREAFFSELTTFLRQLEREEGIANQQFSEYALERLQLTIVAVGSIRSGLHAFENDHGLREAVLYYSSTMDELLVCLQSLSVLWTNYVDSLLSSADVHIAYRAPTIRTG